MAEWVRQMLAGCKTCVLCKVFCDRLFILKGRGGVGGGYVEKDWILDACLQSILFTKIHSPCIIFISDTDSVGIILRSPRGTMKSSTYFPLVRYSGQCGSTSIWTTCFWVSSSDLTLNLNRLRWRTWIKPAGCVCFSFFFSFGWDFPLQHLISICMCQSLV